MKLLQQIKKAANEFVENFGGFLYDSKKINEFIIRMSGRQGMKTIFVTLFSNRVEMVFLYRNEEKSRYIFDIDKEFDFTAFNKALEDIVKSRNEKHVVKT